MPIGASKVGALGGLVPGGSETFNASGTFVVPPGVKLVSITGAGGAGNPGTSGNSGNSGNAGTGGAGGGGGGAVGPTQTQIGGDGGKVWYPLPAGGSYRGCGRGGFHSGYWSGFTCPGLPGNGTSGQSGGTGQAGQAGQAGQPGQTGQASSGLSKTFCGGAAGNAGNAGNAGSAGSGGGGGNGGGRANNSCYGNGGNGGSGGGQGMRGTPPAPPPFSPPCFPAQSGGPGGGGAGATNNGTTLPYPFPNNRPITALAGGGNTSGYSFSQNPVQGSIAGQFCWPNGSPNSNTTGGIGGRGDSGQGKGGGCAIGANSQCANAPGFDDRTVLRSPPYHPTWSSSYNYTNPAIRSGSGGAGGGGAPNSNGGSSAGGGGGGGRGNAGGCGGAGGAGGCGSAGTPATYNCVPVISGCSYPITVGAPGGSVVISWNPQ